jgi:hypothetical protein
MRQPEIHDTPFANDNAMDDNCHGIVAPECSSKVVGAWKHTTEAVTTIGRESKRGRLLVAHRFTIQLQQADLGADDWFAGN